MKLYGYRVF